MSVLSCAFNCPSNSQHVTSSSGNHLSCMLCLIRCQTLILIPFQRQSLQYNATCMYLSMLLFRPCMVLPLPDHPLMTYTSFCLTKNARRCVSCHAQVTPRTASWISVHRTTRELVLSDWSRNSASRSCTVVSIP